MYAHFGREGRERAVLLPSFFSHDRPPLRLSVSATARETDADDHASTKKNHPHAQKVQSTGGRRRTRGRNPRKKSLLAKMWGRCRLKWRSFPSHSQNECEGNVTPHFFRGREMDRPLYLSSKAERLRACSFRALFILSDLCGLSSRPLPSPLSIARLLSPAFVRGSTRSATRTTRRPLRQGATFPLGARA